MTDNPAIQRAVTRALEALIGEFSESSYAAGWMADIEHIVWRAMVDGDMKPIGRGVALDPDEIADLRTLSDLIGGWVRWDDTAGEVVFVPMAEWERLYAEEGR